MVATVTYARFLLYPGEVLRLDNREPLNILSEQGTLWVTVGEEGIDHDLLPGASISCGAGRVLIEGPGIVALAGTSSRGLHRAAAPFVNLALLAPTLNKQLIDMRKI